MVICLVGLLVSVCVLHGNKVRVSGLVFFGYKNMELRCDESGVVKVHAEN